jgi:DNA (cytosine-5)-methyltransferase 1
MIKYLKTFKRYAVKNLKNKVSRIYINDTKELVNSNLPINARFNIEYSKHGIKVIPCENGTNKIMETSGGRSGLLELKNKSTFDSFGDVSHVMVTFGKDGVEITLNYSDRQKIIREAAIIRKIKNGEPIEAGSFFSGLGLLSLFIKTGMEKAGIKTKIKFANDLCDKAMSVNLSSNPIWDDASDDAVAMINDLNSIDLSLLPKVDLLEIGYPCIAMSKLCKKEHRDTLHPVVGTLFIKLIAAISAMNPAVFIIENVESFLGSDSFRMIKQELKADYNFSEISFNGNNFGDIEGRPRTCVVATSIGLPAIMMNDFYAPAIANKKTLSHYLDDIAPSSPLWREMAHVKKKLDNPKLNFKNTLYDGSEDCIGTITASYSAPKIGSPMLAHPTNKNLQRQFTVNEHANIRQLPSKMHQAVLDIANGASELVSRAGSITAAHRMLGNSVSKLSWEEIGNYIGLRILPFSDLKASN